MYQFKMMFYLNISKLVLVILTIGVIKFTSLNLIQTVFQGLLRLKIVEDMLISSPKVTLDLDYKYWISMIMATIIG